MSNSHSSRKTTDLQKGGAANLKVARNAPIRDQVADNLRSAIVNMHFQPGQLLVERELCELLDTSRASLRQALRVLETEGLIETQNGRGITVAEVTPTQVNELYMVRAHLEGLAVRLITTLADDEVDQRLVACLDEMEQARQMGEINTRLLETKDTFYRIIFDTIQNETLEQYLGMVHRRIPHMRATSITQPGRGDLAAEEMRRVVDAILARDSDLAEAAIKEHVENAAKAALASTP